MRTPSIAAVVLLGFQLTSACGSDGSSKPTADAEVATDGESTRDDGGLATATDAESSDASEDASTAPDAQEDLTGLIPTSGSHLAFYASSGQQYEAGVLYGLDLKNGQKHDLGKPPGWYVATEVSPDATNLLFGNMNGIVFTNLYLARFTDKGILPGESLAQTLPCSGNQGSIKWLGGGRFAMLECRAQTGGHSLQLLDTWKRKLHWSDKRDASKSAVSNPAPRGEWFTYRLANDLMAPDMLGHVTATGVESEALAGGATFRLFDAAGTSVAYALVDKDRNEAKVFVKPIVGQPVLRGTLSNTSFMSVDGFDPDTGRLFAARIVVAGSAQAISIAADGAVTELSNPARIANVRRVSHDGKTVLFQYDGSPGEIALRDSTGAHAELSVTRESFLVSGNVGRYFSYKVNDESYWLVRRTDDNQLVQARISEPAEKGFTCDTHNTPEAPIGRLVFRDGVTTKLVLVDTSSDVPKRVTTLEPAPGKKLSCPQWSPDGSSFAYAEYSDSGSRIHQVSWTGTPESKVIYEGAELIASVLLFRP